MKDLSKITLILLMLLAAPLYAESASKGAAAQEADEPEEKPHKTVVKLPAPNYMRFNRDLQEWCDALQRDGRRVRFLATIEPFVVRDETCSACRPFFGILASACRPPKVKAPK